MDGAVDASDLNELAQSWQQNVTQWSRGDFTANGVVDAADLNELALNWQTGIPMATASAAPIPEPSALAMLSIAFFGIWWLRRQSL